MTLDRTNEELIARIRECKDRDIFGWEYMEYVRALPRDAAETLRGEVIKEDADLSDWAPDLNNRDALVKQCHEYMPFAWEKANGCRGLSAARSLMQYKAWLWPLGEDGFEDVDDYQFYGKDELRRICELLRIDADQWDDGVRVTSEDEL